MYIVTRVFFHHICHFFTLILTSIIDTETVLNPRWLKSSKKAEPNLPTVLD